MKKLCCTIIIIFSLFGFTNAQTSLFSVGAGLEAAFPAGGDFSNGSSTGFGFTANVDYDLNVLPLTLTGMIGYLHFGSKSGGNDVFGSYVGESANVIPLLGGVKYYFLPNFGLYGTALLGVEFFSFSSDQNANVSTQLNARVTYSTQTATENKFAFGLGGGYEFSLTVGSIDLSMRFMIINEANTFNLRAAYLYRF